MEKYQFKDVYYNCEESYRSGKFGICAKFTCVCHNINDCNPGSNSFTAMKMVPLES